MGKCKTLVMKHFVCAYNKIAHHFFLAQNEVGYFIFR